MSTALVFAIGPDFALGRIDHWQRTEGGGELVLDDGSRWHLPADLPNARALADILDALYQRKALVFLTGDRRSGAIVTVDLPQALAVERVDPPRDGRIGVLFQGPPTLYYLRTDRPWAKKAEALIRKSLDGGGSFSAPDLLVSIESIGGEILDVRPLK